MTARIGPTLERATKPKESEAEFLSERMEARPTPKAMIKGTVMGPVVTPPESKATAMKDLGTKKEATSKAIYSTISMAERLIL